MSAVQDELHDNQTDLEDPGPLGRYLQFCKENLLGPYREADREALRNQRLHRLFTRLAGGLGALGLLIAALNTAFPEEHGPLWPPHSRYDWFLLLQGAASLLATACVLAGLIFDWHKKWLVARYKAERLRLIKFRFLVDPDFWCAGADAPAGQNHLRNEIRRIAAIQEDDLPTLSQQEEIPSLPSEAACERLTPAQRLELLAYYRRKRLEFQIPYFAAIARREARRWYQSPRWLPLVFFSSVVFVVFHTFLEYSGSPRRRDLGPESAAAAPARPLQEAAEDPIEKGRRAALALSLGIPALWAAIRTYRTANEFGRNKSRSLAKHSALTKIADRLSPEAAPADIFSDVGLCEYVLASDQGEWLRLMREAEWYG